MACLSPGKRFVLPWEQQGVSCDAAASDAERQELSLDGAVRVQSV